jgi:hypothetical protein
MSMIKSGEAYQLYKRTGIVCGMWEGHFELPAGAPDLQKAMTGRWKPNQPMTEGGFYQMLEDRWQQELARREGLEPSNDIANRIVGDRE